jgi:two-component system chemotaxis response regulator CheB
MKHDQHKYKAVVIGVSSGGLSALRTFVSGLPGDFRLPVIIVQHIGPHSEGSWIGLLIQKSKVRIKEADEKEKIEDGTIYVAPPNYHLLVEKDRTLSLNISERVNYARPSIDVLFESAADAYKDELIGVIMTGSNNDGSSGLKRIKDKGGMAIVQDPATAESGYMPASAIAATKVDYILPLKEIIDLLIKISTNHK